MVDLVSVCHDPSTRQNKPHVEARRFIAMKTEYASFVYPPQENVLWIDQYCIENFTTKPVNSLIISSVQHDRPSGTPRIIVRSKEICDDGHVGSSSRLHRASNRDPSILFDSRSYLEAIVTRLVAIGYEIIKNDRNLVHFDQVRRRPFPSYGERFARNLRTLMVNNDVSIFNWIYCKAACPYGRLQTIVFAETVRKLLQFFSALFFQGNLPHPLRLVPSRPPLSINSALTVALVHGERLSLPIGDAIHRRINEMSFVDESRISSSSMFDECWDFSTPEICIVFVQDSSTETLSVVNTGSTVQKSIQDLCLCGTPVRSNFITQLEIRDDCHVTPLVDLLRASNDKPRQGIDTLSPDIVDRGPSVYVRQELVENELQQFKPNRRHDGLLHGILEHKARDYAIKKGYNELISLYLSVSALFASTAPPDRSELAQFMSCEFRNSSSPPQVKTIRSAFTAVVFRLLDPLINVMKNKNARAIVDYRLLGIAISCTVSMLDDVKYMRCVPQVDCSIFSTHENDCLDDL